MIGGIGIEKCPKGHFCPNNTGLNWPPCPAGTYNPREGCSEKSECLPCTGGHFCGQSGLLEPTGLCKAGFYCEEGNQHPDPVQMNCSLSGVGNQCWKGHMCPAGSKKPVECHSGTYQDRFGQTTCKPCPKGFYCLSKTSDYTAFKCSPGYYCPENTSASDQYPCPAGKYNPSEGKGEIEDCQPCPGGKYCLQGSDSPSGNITGGFYCNIGCKGPVPSPGDKVEDCPIGFYCPSGLILIHHIVIQMDGLTKRYKDLL